MTNFRAGSRVWRSHAVGQTGFTVAAVLSLALGIGANTTIFSLINASLLADLPYRESDRLVALWTSFVDRPAVRNSSTAQNYLAWKEQARSFEAVGATWGFQATLAALKTARPPTRPGDAFHRVDVGRARRAPASRTGLHPRRRSQRQPGSRCRHQLWLLAAPLRWRSEDRRQDDAARRRRDGHHRRDARGLRLREHRHRPLGPRRLHATADQRGVVSSWTARLRPDVSIDQAQAEMRALSQGLAAQIPERNKNVTAAVQDLRASLYDDLQRPLLVLQGQRWGLCC